jgi:phosphoglycolate phosphatase
VVGPRTLELIAFDFDGVIADTVVDIATAANEVLSEFNLPAVPVSAVRSQIGGGVEALVRGLLAGHPNVPLDVAAARFRDRYGRCFDHQTTLFPGVAEVLDELGSAGLRMAIATNKAEALTKHLVEKLGVARHFFLIVGPESVARRKPDPETLTRILQAANALPAHAMMIGDTAADIRCGRAAGTRTCAVTYGYGEEIDLADAQPDFTIARLGDLLDHVVTPARLA